MPKVSVIIPNYNHSRFLVQRIESILNQTYQDFELILMDDCSTDNSRRIIEAYENHPNVSKILLNNQNSGSAFKQWSKGINESVGRYIWIAESDDWAEDTFLAELVPLLENHPQVGVVYCQSNMVDEQGKIISDMSWWTDDLSNERWKSGFVGYGKVEFEQYMLYKCTIPNASAVIVKKDILKNKINIALSYQYCGDWRLWGELLLQTDIAYCALHLNNFRSHSQSTRSSGQNGKVKLRTLEIYCLLNQFLSLLQITSWSKKNALYNYYFKIHFPFKSGLDTIKNIDLQLALLKYDPLILIRSFRFLMKRVIGI